MYYFERIRREAIFANNTEISARVHVIVSTREIRSLPAIRPRPYLSKRDNPLYRRDDTNIRCDDTVFFGLSLFSHIINSVEFGSQPQPPSHSEQSDAEPINQTVLMFTLLLHFLCPLQNVVSQLLDLRRQPPGVGNQRR